MNYSSNEFPPTYSWPRSYYVLPKQVALEIALVDDLLRLFLDITAFSDSQTAS